MPAQTPPDPTARHRASTPSAPGQNPVPPASGALAPTRIPSGAPSSVARRAAKGSAWPRSASYWPTLGALSLLCASLVVLVFLIVAHVDLAVATADLRQDPRSLSVRELALLVLSLSIPLATALMSYLVAAQAVRLLRIALYLRRLHAYTGQRLRDAAPLYQRGMLARVQPVLDAQASAVISGRVVSAGDAFPAQRLLSAGGPIVLTGEAGSGKTTALLCLAYELSRPASVLPVFLKRRRLPLLVPLVTHTAAGMDGQQLGPQLEALQAQIARYGSAGLATRLPAWLRDGRILLLCDSLSDVALGMQSHVLHHLGQLAGASSRSRDVPLIVARSGALGAAFPAYLAGHLGQRWQHWCMAPLASEDVLRVAQTGIKGAASRRPTQSSKAFRDELQALRLDRSLDKPALLLSYAALRSAGTPMPYGRSALLMQTLELTCASAASDGLPAGRLRDTLATLASALVNADLRAVPLPPGVHLGDALAGWLAAHRPYSPLLALKSGPLAIAPDVAHACCPAALKAGLLVVSSDDASIAFANSLVEATCAAAWLRLADDGSSPFDPGLLRPRWALPVILWAATVPDPGTVTRRLLPLASTRPDTHNTLALATIAAQARPTNATAATLALGGLTAAIAPAVSSFQIESGEHGFEIARFERRLREVLDGVLDVLTPDPDPTVLSRAAQAVEGEVGDELAADIAYLASYSALSRLARAQLLTILGLLASPLALLALVEHLGDRDPTLRSAVNRGFALVGTRAVPILQQQLTSADEWTRTRAREALDGISAASVAAGTTAPDRAIRALVAPDPRQRAAAAQTLGALRAYGALDALVGRLGDPDAQVRVATLEALATLADPTARDAVRALHADPEPAVRAALAETLGAYRDASLLGDLAALLRDSDSNVRGAAATALGVLGDGRAVRELMSQRDDPDPHTQAAIAGALRRLGDAPEVGALRGSLLPQR